MEWHPAKAAANLATHGVFFEEAGTVFADSLSSVVADPDHSLQEERLVIFGASDRGRVLAVIWGKYAAGYAEGTNLVLLDPDVAAAFPDAAAVNGALRGLLELARRQVRVAGQAPAAEARLTRR